jgi:drug/metabolite transporter (DMT)-like permease
MALLGVFQLGLPCMLLIRAAKFLSPAEISLLSLLEVLLGPLWVWWGVGEMPSQATIVGGSIVLLGLVLHEVAPMRQSERLKQIMSPSNTEPGI